MPHVGGGSSGGGGFSHSSGGGTTSIPKTDVYGNPHSKHYYRPGFYYNSIYIPYSRVNRKFVALKNVFLTFFITIVFTLVGILAFNKGVGKNTSKLQEYALNEYSKVYSPSSASYEYNLLIEIVPFKNLDGIDYMPIVGDNVNKEIDYMFGNENTIFGSHLKANLDKDSDEVHNIYLILANSLNEAMTKIGSKYYNSNNESAKINNDTDIEIVGYNELVNSQKNFYELTGYQISFVISQYEAVYKNDYTLGFIFTGVAIIMFGFSIYLVIKTLKAVKFIDKEERNGNGAKYFEGEVDYDTYVKDHPINSKIKYDRNEYDYLLNKTKIKDE